MEQQITESEGLALIESMINKAKNSFSESGFTYLLWGTVVFLCSLIQFAGVYFWHYEKSYYIWEVTWLVVLCQTIFMKRQRQRLSVRTYTHDIIKYIWGCFVVCLFLLIYLLIQQGLYGFVDTAILILYGMPTALSGAVLKFRPLVFGAIACWLLAIASVFVPDEFRVLLISLAVLVAWIVPGIALRKKYLKEKRQ